MTDEIKTLPAIFEGHHVRVVLQDGEPWWVLTDVCKVLEIGNPRDVGRRLDADEKAAVDIIDGRQRRRITTVNESGLYAALFISRKPIAKRFSKWVRSELLPSIRKGTYAPSGGGRSPSPEPTDPWAALEPPPTASGLPTLPPLYTLDPFKQPDQDPSLVARRYAWELVEKDFTRQHAKLMTFMELVWMDQPSAAPAAIAHFAIANPYILDHPALWAHATAKMHRLR